MSKNFEEQLPDLSIAEKRALLTELLRQEESKVQIYPLSFAQQRLWFLTQLEPDNPSYNLRHALRLQGELDVDALEQTINHIIRRHESLRTTFKALNGHPVQIVANHHELHLTFVNLDHLPYAESECEAHRLAVEEVWRPFDLSHEYPIRVKLVRLEHAHHWLLLTLHHIAGDGWSMGILNKEISTIYNAITTGRPIDLPELQVQYADFAEWQHEWLQGEVLTDQLNFWLKSLAGAPPELKLPLDYPRLAQQSYEGASASLRLGQELTQGLGKLSRGEGGTIFMTMLAAFKALLFRYTGQSDIVVGTPIAGRNRVEIENLIGFFVNTLALRTNVSHNTTFRELLQQVKEVTLGAYTHQDLPFERLVKELNPEREGNHSPIFQVVFGMQNEPSEALTMHGLNISRVPLATRTAKFDLTLFVSETADGLACRVEYSTDLFKEATIKRMLGHLEGLLKGIVENPDAAIWQLPLLTPGEQLQLAEWNRTQTDFPKDQCIHDIFTQQVEKRPNAVALEFQTQRLTYAELDQRANQLAHYLRRRGVGPNEIVGLCAERSPEMFVGMLGILKAGGAYLPLDAAYPPERLSFMLEDGKVRVLLTQEHLQATLPAAAVETILLDSHWNDIARGSADCPESNVTPENLAYLMYTSGSTGKPKGVAVPHRAVVRLVQQTNYARFGPEEVFLQFAPLSFDASTFEIWGSLLNRGRLVVLPSGLISLGDLGDAIKQHGVTTLWLTAGLFHQMVETQLESLRGLRQLLAGGNVLSVPHVERLVRELKECQLINGYGPTENTTFTCCYSVGAGELFASGVPIGFPISNTEAYILDDHMQQVPIGVAGELYTGGAGLASGYQNAAALTAEKFVPHPLSTTPGARLYRTGDRTRYREDGSIEFLGRLDHQVKLRGYRIELAEVEIAMKAHPAVEHAIAVLGESAQREKYLVGYVVAAPSHPALRNSALTTELKALLRKSLPDYMIPAYFVVLEKLPLMASGKIDIRALPAPNGSRPELEKPHIAPRDDLEKRLAQTFERVLEVQGVGIRDNFFDLGGHSLLAVRLVAEIEKEVGQRLPLVSFFQGANIEYLASLLRQDLRSVSWPTLVEIQKGNGDAPLFCVSMPNVNALGYRALAHYLGPDQTVFGLQAQYPRDLDGEFSQAVVDRMATQYLEALQVARPEGPYQFIGLCRGAHIAYEMARRLEQEGQPVALLAILDTWVAENTYNIFFYLKHYANRALWLTRVGLKDKISFLTKKTRRTLKDFAVGAANRKRNPVHELYFPGPDFVPRIYSGRIEVFRARHQPRERIRDSSLGWGKLAAGGVDVHFIPGSHESVLKEPYVRGLADELKKCLLNNSDDSRSAIHDFE